MAGMERCGYRDDAGLDAGGLEFLYGLFHHVRLARDHGLCRGVDVGDGYIQPEFVDLPGDTVLAGLHHGHGADARCLDLLGETAAPGGKPVESLARQDTRGGQGRVFTETVAADNIRFQAESPEDVKRGHVHDGQRGLCNLRVVQPGLDVAALLRIENWQGIDIVGKGRVKLIGQQPVGVLQVAEKLG